MARQNKKCEQLARRVFMIIELLPQTAAFDICTCWASPQAILSSLPPSSSSSSHHHRQRRPPDAAAFDIVLLPSPAAVPVVLLPSSTPMDPGRGGQRPTNPGGEDGSCQIEAAVGHQSPRHLPPPSSDTTTIGAHRRSLGREGRGVGGWESEGHPSPRPPPPVSSLVTPPGAARSRSVRTVEERKKEIGEERKKERR
uniref:Uncharacterized protein n=1 Tax=Oryza punctata TaxID=4537 RepID=A0A0E0MHZ0_ORYPU